MYFHLMLLLKLLCKYYNYYNDTPKYQPWASPSIWYIWTVFINDIFSFSSSLVFCPSQWRRLTGLRSPAWPNVSKGLRKESSWRTTVYLWWERRSWRRCPRKHRQSTTSAVCWTKPLTLRRDPGISLIFTSCWLHCARVLVCSYSQC